MRATSDQVTLVTMAANPHTDPDILDQLRRHAHPDVSWTASATMAGQPAGPHVDRLIARARAVDAPEHHRPLRTSSPVGAPFISEPGDEALPDLDRAEIPSRVRTGSSETHLIRPSPDDGSRPRRRRVLALAAGTLCVTAASILTITFTRGTAQPSARIDPGVQMTTQVTDPSTMTTVAPTLSTTTVTKATPSPATAAPPAPTAVSPAPVAPSATQPPPRATPPKMPSVRQVFTISSSAGRFCDKVQVTVNFSPEPGSVHITDDSGTVIGTFNGRSGQTNQFALARPTARLDIEVAAVGASMSVSGRATGPSC